MITFINNSPDKPFVELRNRYMNALDNNQKSIEAVCISSYSNIKNEVTARFVNLKIVDTNQLIFFTNYKSDKASDFETNNQAAITIFWNKTNVQIRLKGTMKKKSSIYNEEYFYSRSKEKNALAISSMQSKKIASYKDVVKKYNEVFLKDDLSKCPSYWGGYSFSPYYFEFWDGHKSRVNKRYVYELVKNKWVEYYLEP